MKQLYQKYQKSDEIWLVDVYQKEDNYFLTKFATELNNWK